MEKLPDEMLDLVFSDLHLYQKQECMLVCRQWFSIIYSRSLFSTIHIRSADMFDRLNRILDDNPPYRLQIKSLVLHGNFNLATVANRLAQYFPSVRFIYGAPNDFFRRSLSGLNTDQLESNSKWRNQIEILELHRHRRYFGNNQDLSVFSGLKKLVIYDSSNRHTPNSIIQSAPNVNTLVLVNGYVSLLYLDLLLTGLKSLRSLTLEKIKLLPVRELNFDNSTHLLTTLCINFEYPGDSEDIRERANNMADWLQYITKTCTKLRHLKFIFPWTNHTMHQRELYITYDGLVPLLHQLGHQLEYIEINSSDGMSDILDTLGTLNNEKQMVHINTLINANRRASGQILLNDQTRFIKQLTINVDNVTIKTLDYLRHIKKLQRLKIRCSNQRHGGNRTLLLNELLNSISDSLESLEIYDFIIDSQDTVSPRISLNELAFHSRSISQNVYPFISRCLPSLKRLTIDQPVYNNNSNIMLEGVNLQYLEISFSPDFFNRHNLFISLTTLNNGVSRCYRSDPYKTSDQYPSYLNSVQLYEPIKQPVFETTPDTDQVLEISCNSVNTFVVNKRLAF